ncbi:MAG: 2-amino-4-ketopentanoate thiolase [Clostridia bacterium]|nr:2-amino-4-ketopentanoate thiolase [Clostridia bacterium]
MSKKNDYVQIHRTVLTPDLRSKNLPEETHTKPLEMWVKGYLQEESANVGDSVTVITRTGRVAQGTLCDEAPHFEHSWGKLIPELLHVGDQVREIVFGGEE